VSKNTDIHLRIPQGKGADRQCQNYDSAMDGIGTSVLRSSLSTPPSEAATSTVKASTHTFVSALD
jgi:hypothetical protein